MAEILTYRGQRYEVCECGICGATFFVLEVVRNEQRRAGGFSSCPNGHRWGYDAENSEVARTRRERDQLRQQMAQRDDELRRVNRELNKACETMKAQDRRIRMQARRSAAGVCQCCNRTFLQLARHMKNKHPNFTAEACNPVDSPIPMN